jgi:hypothetical protein
MKRLAMLLVLATATATALFAHDLFLKLQTYVIPSGTTARVAVLNGTFTSSAGAVTPDRLIDLSLVGPGGRRTLPRDAWTPVGDTTWLSVPTGAAGTYVIGASLLPRQIALSAEDFNRFLEEDGIPDVLEARRRQGALGRPVRERYQKHVKAILQVGDARTDAFATPLGYPAELVPLTNPYAIRAGDTLAIRALVSGRPVAQQLVIAGGEREGRSIPEARYRSDADGVARIALTTAGRWYVKFIHMEAATRDTVDYVSQWATLTFEVR